VHGVGGFVGTVLVAVFASETFGGNQAGLAIGPQLGKQLLAIAFAVVYTAALTWGILRVVMAAIGLRVGNGDETAGLDVSLHGEGGYNL
jgi:Amt family ammonium transporter